MKKIFLIISLLCIYFTLNASIDKDAELKVLKITGREKDVKTLLSWDNGDKVVRDRVVIRFRNSFSALVFLMNDEIAGGYTLDQRDGLTINHSWKPPMMSM